MAMNLFVLFFTSHILLQQGPKDTKVLSHIFLLIYDTQKRISFFSKAPTTITCNQTYLLPSLASPYSSKQLFSIISHGPGKFSATLQLQDI